MMSDDPWQSGNVTAQTHEKSPQKNRWAVF